MKTVHNRDETCLGIYMGDGSFYVAVLKDEALMKTATPDRSRRVANPDVSVLQKPDP